MGIDLPQHTKAKPIDARQHVWWHRVRRLRSFGFVALLGAFASPLLTVLLFGGVVLFYRYPWSTFAAVAPWMWLLTTPLYVGACAWTWVYMEKRYSATLALHCPHCGYVLRGIHGTRCPECGSRLHSIALPDPDPYLPQTCRPPPSSVEPWDTS